MYLGQLIAYHRTVNKMTLKEFSKRSGLSVAYINQLEKNCNPKTNGPIVPSLETFDKVAKAMNTTLDELLKSVDENQPVGINSISPECDKDNSSSTLGEDEVLLLNKYNTLNDEGKGKIIDYIMDICASNKYIIK